MLTIVEIARGPDGRHAMQAQSGRKECWLEGWTVLPPGLQAAFEACGGWCELALENGTLTGLIPDADNPMERCRAMEALEAEIGQCKAQLSATDYQVIKCAEAQLLGAFAPYDVAELTAARQELRDKINAAQAELERLKNQA